MEFTTLHMVITKYNCVLLLSGILSYWKCLVLSSISISPVY